MKRRTVGRRLLAAAALPLAGCAGDRATSRNGSPTTTTSPARNRVSVSTSPSDVEGSPIDFGIDVTQNGLEAPKIATLRLYVENTGDEKVFPAVESGVPAPFGVLSAEPVDDGPEFQLWSRAYAESEYVFTEDRAVTGRTMQTLLIALEPGERVEETYAIRTDVGGLRDGLRDGEYRVTTYDGHGPIVDGVERTVTLSVES